MIDQLVYKSKPSTEGPKRRYVVVGVKNENGTYRIGLSIASEKEQFVKKRGIEIAKGRANKRPISESVLFNEEESSIQNQFTKFAKDLPKKIPELFSKEKWVQQNSRIPSKNRGSSEEYVDSVSFKNYFERN